MVTTISAPLPAPDKKPNGICNRCRRIWSLEERQGICPICGESAICLTSRTKPRPFKSSSRRKQRQQPINGYEHLSGEWLTYYKVAEPFANTVPDREDLLHTIIANLADAGRSDGHKPDNASWMYRIASFTKARYWREHYRHTNGLTCGNCSKAKRRKCKDDWLYGDCPKLIKMESLNKPIIDSDGNLTELGELIADDKAIDLDAWVDARTFLLNAPKRLMEIAMKLNEGINLNATDSQYLWRYRKQTQNRLEGM
ncbi:hypothetical protein ACFLXC_05655 [Chloroflexota bacterium]